jgi:predicted nuclease of predicted toxin-antitoxin system
VRILADVNVPEEHVAALRGDGHEVVWSRHVPELGPEATDEAIVEYAERERFGVLSTDAKDFGNVDAPVAVFVATQEMTGGEVRTAVAHLNALSFDPTDADPIWLSGV